MPGKLVKVFTAAGQQASNICMYNAHTHTLIYNIYIYIFCFGFTRGEFWRPAGASRGDENGAHTHTYNIYIFIYLFICIYI